MTTPLDAGPDPDPPGHRRGLESYPEFLAYPIDPDAHETTVIPRVRTDGPPPYQTPYSPPPPITEDVTREGNQPPQVPAPVYPETYIKDKPPAYPPPPPEQTR